MPNINTILSMLSPAARGQFAAASANPALQQQLEKELNRLMQTKATSFAASLDPRVNKDALSALSNLIGRGAATGGLVGGLGGGALGFLATPGTEEENLLGGRKYRAASLGDRLSNALLFAGLGAGIGTGVGAYNLRNLAKDLAAKGQAPSAASAEHFIQGAGLVPEFENAVKQFAGGKIKSVNPTSVFPTVDAFADYLVIRRDQLLKNIQAKGGLNAFLSHPDPNDIMVAHALSNATGIPIKDIISNPSIEGAIRAAAPITYSNPAINDRVFKGMRDIIESGLGGHLKSRAGLEFGDDLAMSVSGGMGGAAVGALTGAITGAALGGTSSAGLAAIPGAVVGAGLGMVAPSRLNQLKNMLTGRRHGQADAALERIMKGNPQFEITGGKPDAKAVGEYMNAVRNSKNPVFRTHNLTNEGFEAGMRELASPLGMRYSDMPAAIGLGAGVGAAGLGAGALGGAYLLSGRGGSSAPGMSAPIKSNKEEKQRQEKDEPAARGHLPPPAIPGDERSQRRRPDLQFPQPNASIFTDEYIPLNRAFIGYPQYPSGFPGLTKLNSAKPRRKYSMDMVKFVKSMQ